MDKKDIKTILDKYKAGIASEEEIALLESWYLNFTLQASENITEDERLQTFNRVWANLENVQATKSTIRLWPRFVAAASILIFLSVGSYFLLNKPGDQQLVKIQTHDIAPGSNKAILTLANGKKIILNDAQNGKLVQQGNAAITKMQNGQIVYKAADDGKAVAMAYNTTTTPRGGEYHITLADGTNVWLNAASSITYPTTFNGNNRTVEITGEAYFEVAHNATQPFRVKSTGQTVEVLGTHFNINSYEDEPASKTTLLKGSVKVTKGQASVTLKPGQQSVIIGNGSNSSINVLNDVNTDRVLAWKNGKFSFDNADIKTVMREIGRWYNVEILYEGKIQSTVFSGEIYRNVNLSKALEILGFTKVNFRIEGRKIIITS
jgi:transmembrane sensor